MIKETDLKIGIWFNYFHRPTRINNWTELLNSFDHLKNGFITAILLTEEILVKCGFEVYEFDNGQPNQYRLKERLIVIRDGFFYEYGSGVKLEYLHQLQNIYFLLTGIELKYKP